jgi:invasion protein IalB
MLKMIFVAALLAGPTAGLAQETATDQASDLDLGEPVGPAVGEPYVREEFGDWALRCIRAQEGPDPCNLYQLLVNDGGVAVSEFNIFPLPASSRAAAGATVIVPLETLLPEQLTITIDGGEARLYPFTFCNRAGCVARLGFTQEQVDRLKAGSAATLRIVPAGAPDEEVILTLSLRGFTAGFDSTTAE